MSIICLLYTLFAVYLLLICCLPVCYLLYVCWCAICCCLPTINCMFTFYLYCCISPASMSVCFCTLYFYILWAHGMMYVFSCLSSLSLLSMCMITVNYILYVWLCLFYYLPVLSVDFLSDVSYMSVRYLLNGCLLYICFLCVYMQQVCQSYICLQSVLSVCLLPSVYYLSRVEILLENK